MPISARPTTTAALAPASPWTRTCWFARGHAARPANVERSTSERALSLWPVQKRKRARSGLARSSSPKRPFATSGPPASKTASAAVDSATSPTAPPPIAPTAAAPTRAAATRAPSPACPSTPVGHGPCGASASSGRSTLGSVTAYGPGQADNSLRRIEGLVCPRCRLVITDPTEGTALTRCPRHPNTVLVPTRALADADGDPFLGRIVAGRFAVLELLGAGSMATVYRARQEAMGRDVALKIVRSERLVDKQAKGRFRQEAHAMSLLASPHTVTVFDFGEILIRGPDPYAISGSLFLAMELLHGQSLGNRLKAVGRVAPAEAVRIVRHALISLAEAHG
ncbi:MAG: hypothetical protein JRI68_31355, partial [Deltaproteobacteria bacterium]|nr:hypothetical protein [Deltaproteobacteria bacterium]